MTSQHKSLILGMSGACLTVLMAGYIAVHQDNPMSPSRQQTLHGGPELEETITETAPAQAGAKKLTPAERLERRLKNQGLDSPGILALERALAGREAMLKRSVTVTLVPESGSGKTAITAVHLSEHPEWLLFSQSLWAAQFTVDADAVEAAIEAGALDLPLSVPAHVLSTERDGKNLLRATTDHIATGGYDIDVKAAAEAIARAFNGNESSVLLMGRHGEPGMTMDWEGRRVNLTLLSTGLSDFDNSTPGRLHNVHKVIDERLHNVVLLPGEEFSMTAALDAPVTLDKGWQYDQGLCGGGACKMVGAGVCQGATTAFRAALLAGLPILQKRAHSLFVDHYEFYGVGLDATVFPGVHDMRFRNDTKGPIVLQGTTEGITATVRMFGVDDGRSVKLDGPYFVGSKDRAPTVKALGYNQVGWQRTVFNGDASVRIQEPIIASYAKPLWGYVKKKYEHRGQELVTMRE